MNVLYQKIEIDGFKSLKKVSINPSLITLFVGANSSGKSSVLQALTLLKQSTGQQQFRTEGPIINLGQYRDLVSKGSRFMNIGISGDLLAWEPFEYFRESRLQYDMSWRFGANGVLDTVTAIIGSQSIVLEGSWGRDGKAAGGQLKMEDSVVEYQGTPNISMPLVLTGFQGPREKTSILRRDLQKIISSGQKQLELTISVPPLRGQDLPQLELQGSPQSQITSTQGSVEQSSRLASTIAYRRELEGKISNWMERITGVRISSELVPGPRVTIRAHQKKPKIKPIIVNEGYGSNQLVHLMGQIALAPEESSICIDDPEIHLHPKAQAELAELFVEIAKSERKQLLMATHSEHILFRLLTNVAEKKLDPEQLAIYHFSKSNGWTNAKRLMVDKSGTLEQGLPGFFEADVGEFRKYIEAISRKQ